MSVSGRASAGQRRSENLGVLGGGRFCHRSGFFFFSSVLLLFLAIYILHSDDIK